MFFPMKSFIFPADKLVATVAQRHQPLAVFTAEGAVSTFISSIFALSDQVTVQVNTECRVFVMGTIPKAIKQLLRSFIHRQKGKEKLKAGCVCCAGEILSKLNTGARARHKQEV